MSIHRFFIPREWIDGRQVTLIEDTVHQIRHVLRMGAGERIIVLDDSGWEREVELTRVAQNVVLGRVIEERLAPGEPRTKISLYQGVLKAQKFEWVLQKGTELGLIEFIPVVCERSLVGDLEDVDRKLGRWGRIIREAAEQSRRGRLPVLRPAMLFIQGCQRAKRSGGLSLVPWEGEKVSSLKSALTADEAGERPFSISIFIGPEGGLTDEEIETAQRYDVKPVSLGPRILRAETAGLVTAAAILYELGDLEWG
ncbi:MAG: 16S rRNA (uracil(1498)-N(3))-methyltransferase [Anaerolineae bacterium]